MPNLNDIKSRIGSVQNTKKITKAMKMVAAAKVKKAENTVKAARPFADELLFLFRKMLTTVGEITTDGLKIEKAIDNYPALLTRQQSGMANPVHTNTRLPHRHAPNPSILLTSIQART